MRDGRVHIVVHAGGVVMGAAMEWSTSYFVVGFSGLTGVVG